MYLSVVTTLYNSANYILEFYERISKTASALTQNYEIIFVSDGTPDESLAIACELHKNDSKVKVIELSRNFGHQKAMATGLQYAKGDYVFLIDVDLEERPELLATFWQEMNQNKEIDVVYGVQLKRKGGWVERTGGKIFYQLIRKLSEDIITTKDTSTVRLMKRDYVQSLIQFQEQNYYFGLIANLVGFNQKAFPFKKGNRRLSTYSLFKRYHIFINAAISCSDKLLYIIFYIGCCLTAISFLYMLYLIFKKLFFNIALPGWTTLIVLITLLGGMNLFFMGILSIYILHILRETKRRPFSIIRRVYDSNSVCYDKRKITVNDELIY